MRNEDPTSPTDKPRLRTRWELGCVHVWGPTEARVQRCGRCGARCSRDRRSGLIVAFTVDARRQLGELDS